jgi:hypothetical protein
MDWCALQVAWISVIVVGLGLGGGGFLLWWVRNSAIKGGSFDASADEAKWLLAGAIILWILTGIYVLCLGCNFNSLRVAIRIIETAADFFADTKRIVLIPVLFFFIAIGITFAWLYGYICVTSIGTITVPTNGYKLQTKDVAYGTGVS